LEEDIEILAKNEQEQTMSYNQINCINLRKNDKELLASIGS
jgi:hypothetical protein